MKQKFIIEVSFSAMNEMSLYERLRNAVFEWQTTEPKVKSVSVVPAQEKAESLPTGLQQPQPAMCLGCEYWRMPSGGHCMRGEGVEFCFKVGTHAGVR